MDGSQQTKLFLGNVRDDEIEELSGMAADLGFQVVQSWGENVIAITELRISTVENSLSENQVTPSWIKVMARFKKFVEPTFYSTNPRMIFSGFVVHFYQADEDEIVIYGGVTALGGQYQIELERDVTHIITRCWDPKFAALVESGVKVITPEYFDDCFRLGLKCDDKHYIYPHPVIYSSRILEMVENCQSAKSGDLESDFSPSSTSSLLRSEKFFLDDTMKDRTSLLKQLKRHELQICDEFEHATAVIVESQNQVYYNAFRKGLRIGTRRWALSMLSSGTLSDSKNSLFHYPLGVSKIPAFSNFVISVSNYRGCAREDICKMIKDMGAKFTKNLTTANTHLICSAPLGHKYSRALDWNIHVLNHLWLEDCFSRWSYIVEGNPKYYHFTTSLSEIVGKTPHDLSTLLGNKENDVIMTSRKRMNEDDTNESGKKPKAIKVLTTGVNFSSLQNEKMSQNFKEIGIIITNDPTNFDYLVAKKSLRTEKMMLAIAMGKPILTVAWINESLKQRTPLEIEDFWFRYSDEAQLDLKLSISKAKSSPLLANFLVFTSSKDKSAEIFHRIIVASAGESHIVTTPSDYASIKGIVHRSGRNAFALAGPESSDFANSMKSAGVLTYKSNDFIKAIMEQSPIENLEPLVSLAEYEPIDFL